MINGLLLTSPHQSPSHVASSYSTSGKSNSLRLEQSGHNNWCRFRVKKDQKRQLRAPTCEQHGRKMESSLKNQMYVLTSSAVTSNMEVYSSQGHFKCDCTQNRTSIRFCLLLPRPESEQVHTEYNQLNHVQMTGEHYISPSQSTQISLSDTKCHGFLRRNFCRGGLTQIYERPVKI